MDDADDGFVYDNLGTKKGITYYRCAKRGGYFCEGSRKKLANGTYVITQPHNGHPCQNANESLVKTFRDILKRRATAENTSFKSIYDDEARRNPEAAGIYPYSTGEGVMRLARKNSLPPVPPSLADLANLFDLGSLTQYSCCGESLFKGYVGDIDGRGAMIFACTTLIQLVERNNVEEMHIDATFKIVPSNMGRQMLSIHCMIGNHSIPIVYCLMEAKSRNAYNCVFDFLKLNLLANINPNIIITDYETALRDTLAFYFPNSRAVGCWFHHNNAVWKNMKKKGFYS
ncbi:unnamed protein product [Macrosiphum euphorbiae]|uniref:MULE transposase domain-containing protein n=1 Tax=Macrosiphum euphorbiae TaxID=13131 RepID=A0AAV0XLA1_9HEMI|nr:unnamed protein product [Macrosiphum euphorbiae]